MVGVNENGIVEEDEYIFDIYTKSYDFHGSNIKVVSAQELLSFYQSKNMGVDREKAKIYVLVEYFIQHHLEGHFALDECPLIRFRKYI